MDKRKHPLSDKQSIQACEIQSTGKKSKDAVEDLAQQVADQLAGQEEPIPDTVSDNVAQVIQVLAEEGVGGDPEEKYRLKSFGDVMPSSAFYPDLPKKSLTDILDRTYRIDDAAIIDDYEGKFGLSTFALLLCADLDDGVMFTSVCGGMVVVKKIRKALEGKMLPLIATISKVGRYYDIQ